MTLLPLRLRRSRSHALVFAVALAAHAAWAQDDDLTAPKKKAPPKAATKKKAPPPAATAPASELKAPPAAPAAAPAAPPAPAAVSAPETRTIIAQPDLVAPLPEAPPPPPVAPEASPGLRLSVSARAGVAAPLSVLTAGVYAGAQLGWQPLASGLLEVSLGAGYEHHSGLASRIFLGPGGGLDTAAFENQSLLPVELRVALSPWHDELNRLELGAGYALLGVWSATHALGSDRSESGLGHQLSAGAGYARRLGPIGLFLRGDWSVRRTDVGPRTGVLELSWYQVLSLTAGLTYSL